MNLKLLIPLVVAGISAIASIYSGWLQHAPTDTRPTPSPVQQVSGTGSNIQINAQGPVTVTQPPSPPENPAPAPPKRDRQPAQKTVNVMQNSESGNNIAIIK